LRETLREDAELASPPKLSPTILEALASLGGTASRTADGLTALTPLMPAVVALTER
jgi:hypothetical protein